MSRKRRPEPEPPWEPIRREIREQHQRLREMVARWAAESERRRVLDRQAFDAWSERMKQLSRE